MRRPAGAGRIAAFEILRGTSAVGALIRESKTYQLPGILQTGQLSGMNTMDQALLKLAEERKVDAEAAMDRALKKEPFEKLVAEAVEGLPAEFRAMLDNVVIAVEEEPEEEDYVETDD